MCKKEEYKLKSTEGLVVAGVSELIAETVAGDTGAWPPPPSPLDSSPIRVGDKACADIGDR